METPNPTPQVATSVPPTPTPPTPPASKPIVIWIILGIIIGALLTIAGYFAYQRYFLPQISQPIIESSTLTPSPAPDLTAGWKLFSDPINSYTIKYPDDQLVYCDYNNNTFQLWGKPFSCQGPHDIIPLMSIQSVSGQTLAERRQPDGVTTQNINGIQATERRYTYTEADGPLYGIGETTEITIPTTADQIILISLHSNKSKDKQLFKSILSTFKFVDQDNPAFSFLEIIKANTAPMQWSNAQPSTHEYKTINVSGEMIQSSFTGKLDNKLPVFVGTMDADGNSNLSQYGWRLDSSSAGVDGETSYFEKTNSNTTQILVISRTNNTYTIFLGTVPTQPTNNSSYTCPVGGWVNCMPILDEAGQKACSTQAMAWYKENCPDFKGGAM